MKTFLSSAAVHLLIQAEYKLQDEMDCILRAFDSCDNPSHALLARGIEVEELLHITKEKRVSCSKQKTKYFCIPARIFNYLGTHHQY